ncbi:MAG TPA: PfkB family carbohydrate kinase [Pirellulales bacterium]|nr:PfkB family carbohydrate kinase [Pirellulales bacterium]
MIVSAGLTPAWQQILRFTRLHVGQVNRAAEARWCGSGKVLNVGAALATLKVPAVTLAPLGGLAYDAIDEELAALGVERRWVRTDSATRTCTTVLDAASGVTTELVENATALEPDELESFAVLFKQAAAHASVVVLTGSLPEKTPVTFYRELLETTSAQALVDARGPELLAALEAQPLVIKPNREELAKTFDFDSQDDAQIAEAVERLHDRGARWIVVTQGRGPVMIASPGATEHVEPPTVEAVVNPIGCGDCLAAGIAWGLSEGRSVPEAVRLGMAAAAENLGQLLPARLDRARVLARWAAMSRNA